MIMENNNDNKVLNVPHLRFPEFTDEWKESVLSDFVERVKRKNKNTLNKERKSTNELRKRTTAYFNIRTQRHL